MRKLPIARISRLYLRGKTLDELADQFGCDYATIRRHLITAGVEMRPRGRRPGTRLATSKLSPHAAEIARLYRAAGWGCKKLGRRYGVSPQAIHQHLRSYGIQTRPRGRPKKQAA